MVVVCHRQAWRRALLVGAIYVLYVAFGTIVFMIIESDEDEPKITNRTIVESARFVLREHGYTDQDIFKLVQFKSHKKLNFSKLHESGMVVSLTQTMFFSISIITTIGYGQVSPLTWCAKLLSIFYAIFGIPLHLAFTRSLGVNLKSKILKIVEATKVKYPQAHRVELFMDVICILFFFVVFLIIPTLIFMTTEQWTFIEGLYYCAITLSTVGLGDYVAGIAQESNSVYPLYMTAVASWIIIGLGFHSMLSSKIFHCLYNIFSRMSGHNKMEPENIHEGIIEGTQLSRARWYVELITLAEDDDVCEAHIEQIELLIGEIELKMEQDIKDLMCTRDKLKNDLDKWESSSNGSSVP